MPPYPAQRLTCVIAWEESMSWGKLCAFRSRAPAYHSNQNGLSSGRNRCTRSAVFVSPFFT
jgi:hypothetical protein